MWPCKDLWAKCFENFDMSGSRPLAVSQRQLGVAATACYCRLRSIIITLSAQNQTDSLGDQKQIGPWKFIIICFRSCFVEWNSFSLNQAIIVLKLGTFFHFLVHLSAVGPHLPTCVWSIDSTYLAAHACWHQFSSIFLPSVKSSSVVWSIKGLSSRSPCFGCVQPPWTISCKVLVQSGGPITGSRLTAQVARMRTT